MRVVLEMSSALNTEPRLVRSPATREGVARKLCLGFLSRAKRRGSSQCPNLLLVLKECQFLPLPVIFCRDTEVHTPRIQIFKNQGRTTHRRTLAERYPR